MYAIYGFIHPRSTKQREVEHYLSELLQSSRTEPGNIAYKLHKESDGTLFLYELWESKEAVELHNNSQHMQQFLADFWEKQSELLQKNIEVHSSVVEL